MPFLFYLKMRRIFMEMVMERLKTTKFHYLFRKLVISSYLGHPAEFPCFNFRQYLMKQLIIGNCDSQNKKLNKKERPHYFTAPDEFYRQRKKFPYCSSYSNSCFKIINRPQKKLQLKKSMRKSCHKSRFKSKTTSKQFIF